MSLKNLLDELRKDYLATFPEKIKNLRGLWESGQHTDLHMEYHKLKGTGRTYGIPEVSQIGEALEALLESKASDALEILEVAVPMSLDILERIRNARTNGKVLKIEEDRDFRVIVEFVMGLDKSA